MNGRIFEAAAISDNRIVKLGTDSEIKAICKGEATQKIDLKGKTVLPGFNDSHLHVLAYGLEKNQVDLSRAGSPEEVIEITRRFIQKRNKKPGEWVLGSGWGRNSELEKKSLTREDLDKISCEHPIYLLRICSHTAVANSLALKLIGANQDVSVKGGAFDVDENGELNGVIRENALDWFEKRMPQPTKSEMKDALAAAVNEAASYGLTSLQSSDLHHFNCFEDMVELFTSMKDAGKLPVRINEQLYLPEKDMLLEYLERYHNQITEDDFFRPGPLKILTDGSLGARTAALQEEYSNDPENKGVLIYSQEELNDMVSLAHGRGMQVFLHAIGDAAIKSGIDALENAILSKPCLHRHRINHVQIGNRILFERMSKLGLLADIQPAFVGSDWSMVEELVGKERAKTSYAWKTMLDMGIPLAGGSDCPTEKLNPLRGIYSAVTRKGMDDRPEEGFLPEQALTVAEAVSIYTKGSAYACFEEDKKGTLEEGKLADMVVLSEDLFAVDKKDMKEVETVCTIADGKVVYSNGLLV